MIQDHIVMGIRDAALSENIQVMSDLNLNKAVNVVRQSEAVKLQQATLRGSHKEDSTIDAIKGGLCRAQPKQKPWNGKWSGSFKPQNAQGGPSKPLGIPARTEVCSRCGRSPPHGRIQCPAREAVCHKCSKKGHFKSVCRSKSTVEDVTVL